MASAIAELGQTDNETDLANAEVLCVGTEMHAGTEFCAAPTPLGYPESAAAYALCYAHG